MRIQVFTSPSCSHRDAILALVRESLAESGVEGDFEEVQTVSFEDAKEQKSFGSPTIRFEGVDIEYGVREPEEYTNGCRYYNTPEGWKPMPPKSLVIGAINRARSR